MCLISWYDLLRIYSLMSGCIFMSCQNILHNKLEEHIIITMSTMHFRANFLWHSLIDNSIFKML